MKRPDAHFEHLDPRAENPPRELFSGIRRVLAVLLILGGAGAIAGWATDAKQFYFSYLTGYLFSLTIVLGMLFFVMLHHVTDAGWSVVVRRAAEQVLAAMPLLLVLFAPVLFGLLSGQLYQWVRPDSANHLLEHKRPYLNVPFFLIRAAGYFVIWLLLVRILRGKSIRQDQTGETRLSIQMRKWSAPGLILYGLSFTFAAFDWIMTLDAAWFSTVFGVYVWSGSVVAGLCVLILLALALERGPLHGYIASDHLHDLGKLLFAFSVFWAYIAFSQYFLIWYANIPEETAWFLHRWTGTEGAEAHWRPLSVALPIIRFTLPFAVLMGAAAKRKPVVLVAMSVILLFGHYLDLYWLVMPVRHHGMHWSGVWIDASCAVAVASAAGLWISWAMGRSALYPTHDPRLQESLSREHTEEILGADVD